ncbi:hypothetical protein GOP47_0001172, partial [Adiantum capillus-veneris]
MVPSKIRGSRERTPGATGLKVPQELEECDLEGRRRSSLMTSHVKPASSSSPAPSTYGRFTSGSRNFGRLVLSPGLSFLSSAMADARFAEEEVVEEECDDFELASLLQSGFRKKEQSLSL